MKITGHGWGRDEAGGGNFTLVMESRVRLKQNMRSILNMKYDALGCLYS